MKTKIMATALTLIGASNAHAYTWCENSIDKLQLFYVNGMYTTASGYANNLDALDDFQDGYLNHFRKNGEVKGAYNQYEGHIKQLYQVARQKYQDLDRHSPEYIVLTSILGGFIYELSSDQFSTITPFLIDLMSFLPDHEIESEVDFQYAMNGLRIALNSCARIVLIGHSQGNFYANALVNEMTNTYTYENGANLKEYPMLGMMGIASPASSVGGDFGSNHPNLVGVLTNDNDIVMDAVRQLLGAVPANYKAVENLLDATGHGLMASYLYSHGQASVIADNISRITRNLVPFPIFDQHPSSSSAISHIGYSEVSEILDIRFRDGGGYRYDNVPFPVWKSFYDSTSHGSYFNKNIRGKYTFTQLEP
ncbi:TPA: KTSC domain-containing protein [Vibrio vulnificus]|uniref:KTSC domain-containing protein n=1 Tax=Vibrio vulnificus TaxID=672 RepID=UPI0018657668|nr:KTSC domain-containing protein [Vibrio vulnificus]MCU8409753.1 KTSC domain-containing protein [Vibrio vulnificus]HAS6346064.1 KTSC domain-containing protein [Vibrio vulnificus]HAS8323571.1 KTSC domain-containing protein [Vibrio vulnificus]